MHSSLPPLASEHRGALGCGGCQCTKASTWHAARISQTSDVPLNILAIVGPSAKAIRVERANPSRARKSWTACRVLTLCRHLRPKMRRSGRDVEAVVASDGRVDPTWIRCPERCQRSERRERHADELTAREQQPSETATTIIRLFTPSCSWRECQAEGGRAYGVGVPTRIMPKIELRA